jgi:vacuolar-type H+-ATPase subunit I/STV1
MIIEDMEFSYRTYNALKRGGINRFGDILVLDSRSLLHIRNFGMNSFKEVAKKLEKYGYMYPKDEQGNYIWNRKPYKIDEQESVIDIAEQAAKEVEEERKIDPMLSISKAKDEYDELLDIKEKYEALLKTTQEQADNYYKILKEKMDLENYNSRLRDENNNLRDENAGIKVRLEKESSNTDIVAILAHVVEIMKKRGITKLETGISGYSVDIVQKYLFTGRS